LPHAHGTLGADSSRDGPGARGICTLSLGTLDRVAFFFQVA
jgi:hypothetical protein